MAIYGPLIEEAEAAVIVTDADLAFGCMGCARTDELILFSLRQSGIPILELKYPTNEEEGVQFVAAVRKFLAGLPNGGEA
jgi:putative methanogenesis marker protein 5